MFISETHACLRTMFLADVIFHYFVQLQFTCIFFFFYLLTTSTQSNNVVTTFQTTP